MGIETSNQVTANWEKLKIVTSILSALLIPVVIAFVSNSYTTALKTNEIGVKYVEIALSILRAPREQQTSSLRKWAIDIVNHHSNVPLPDSALKELETQDLEQIFNDMQSTPVRNLRGK